MTKMMMRCESTEGLTSTNIFIQLVIAIKVAMDEYNNNYNNNNNNLKIYNTQVSIWI